MDATLAIYPTARKVEELLKSLSRRGVCFDYRIVTFPQLIDDLWLETEAPGRVLSPMGEQLAVGEAIRRTDGSAQNELHAGAASAVLGVVRQLKSASIEPPDLLHPDQLLQACGTMEREAAVRRVAAIAAVFNEYEAILKTAGLGDRHDRERAVLRKLHADETAGLRPRLLERIDRLLVAEIYDFSLLQFMIVSALIRIVGDAEVTIQAAPRRADAANFADLTWNRFVGEESIADRVLPDFVNRGGRRGRLGFLLENLFLRDVAATPPPDSTVALLEAPDPAREIEEVVRRVRRAIESGTAPDRIAILARDLDPWIDPLEAVMRRYGVPLRRHPPRPLLATAPARLALNVLEAPLRDLSRGALTLLLESAASSTDGRRLVSVLERIGYVDCRARPLNECVATERETLRHRIAEATTEDERARRERRLTAFERDADHLTRRLDALAALDRVGGVADHLERLTGAMEAFGFNPSRMTPVAASEAAALLGALAEFESETLAVIGARALPLEQFTEMVRADLAEAALHEPFGPERGVRALAVTDARGLDFDLAFVIGLNDGVFPFYHSDDPLLPDDLKLALGRPLADAIRRRFKGRAPTTLGHLLRTRYDRNSEDWLLFFLALSMPAERVVLSWARADASGNPMLPSPFVHEVIRLLAPGSPDALVERVMPLGIALPAAEDCFTPEEFLNRAAARGALDAPAIARLCGPDRLASIRRRMEVEARRESYFSFPTREELDDHLPLESKSALARREPFHGRVAPDLRLRAMLLGTPGAPRPWSAGSLTNMAQCGFRFFAQRILRLDADEQLEHEASAAEFGSLIHELLRDLFQRNLDFTDAERAIEQTRAFLRERYPDERARARDPLFFDLRWRNTAATLEATVRWECADRSAATDKGIRERMFEREFEFVLHDRPGASASPRGDVTVRGRIDRVELTRDDAGNADWIRVLDYKTSRSSDRYTKLVDAANAEFGLTDLQLPVYAMAAAEIAGRRSPGAALEVGYLIPRSRDKLRLSQPLAEFLFETDPERRAAFARHGVRPLADYIGELVGAALDGAFDVDPLVCDDYCPFRGVCRYSKPIAAPRSP